MVLYRAVETLNLKNDEGIEENTFMNKHAILKDSIKLYRKLKRRKRSHRLDNQSFDIRMVELENLIDIEEDCKEQLVHCLVGKMKKM